MSQTPQTPCGGCAQPLPLSQLYPLTYDMEVEAGAIRSATTRYFCGMCYRLLTQTIDAGITKIQHDRPKWRTNGN